MREKVISDIALVPGGWQSETGETIEDESRKYTLIIPETRVEELRAFLAKVANSFDQEEILLVVRGVDRSVKRARDAGNLDGDLWSE